MGIILGNMLVSECTHCMTIIGLMYNQNELVECVMSEVKVLILYLFYREM